MTTGIPGEGVDEFLADSEFRKLDLKNRRLIIQSKLAQIYTFQGWPKVLEKLKLPQPDFSNENYIPVKFGGGESDAHKRLKSYVAENPGILGLPKSCKTGEIEYQLLSGDSVDVAFRWRGKLVLVEVKSHLSDVSDIRRGLYQCIKYQSVAEAMLGSAGKQQNVRTVLLIESGFPEKLVAEKNIHCIEVLEDVVPS